MANCPNCQRKLTCGCQKRIVNGKQYCTGCVKTATKDNSTLKK